MRARFLALFRPRFSLRTLLVLMVFVAVGLTIWRWPWQQEESGSWLVLNAPPQFRAMVAGPATRARVQYRRGWWGEHLKHGPAEAFDSSGRVVARQLWHDGEQHGQETWYDSAGHVIVEQTWQHNTLTGPFRYGDGFSWLESGEHWRGERHGKCLDQEQWFSRETIERVATFDNGCLHGECLWRSARTGEVLQRGRYETDLLVEWNGEEFGNWEYWTTFNVGDGQPLPIQIDPSLDRNRVPLELPTDSDSFFQLLSLLVPWGLTIEPRYGQIWIVRADEAGNAGDSTGVSEVFPFPGTKLAAAWDKPCVSYALDPGDRTAFGRLAPLVNVSDYWPQHVGVELDIETHFPQLNAAAGIQHRREALARSRSTRAETEDFVLRDWLATRLYQAGLRCELTGDRDRLVILPHWTEGHTASGNP